ncbi:MAG: HPr(Ser) kinase/phosphatase [Candidatus Aureabacteria bacterium]|nr:HPr(Ser) kinase/phosphatase [Candidatus Auribacterota bacterium]
MKDIEQNKKNTTQKFLTVEEFYKNMKDVLKLKIVAGVKGLKRKITVAELNRPGLALTGYFDYFAKRRIQVLGKVEIYYLKTLPPGERKEKIQRLFKQKIPCIIVARQYTPPEEIIRYANQFNTAIMRSPLITMHLVNKATLFLDNAFAPTTTMHATLVEVFGVGVLLIGKSGIGKSECALSLIKRGHRLVSDDVIRIRLEDGIQLYGSGPELTRHFMEIRGIGIINVQTLFGAGCVRKEKRIDLAITLERWDKNTDYDRLGIDEKSIDILGISRPHITIPIRPGREISLIIEAACLNQRLKWMGVNPAKELNDELLRTIKKSTRGN